MWLKKKYNSVKRLRMEIGATNYDVSDLHAGIIFIGSLVILHISIIAHFRVISDTLKVQQFADFQNCTLTYM